MLRYGSQSARWRRCPSPTVNILSSIPICPALHCGSIQVARSVTRFSIGRRLRRKSVGLHGVVTAEEARNAARRLVDVAAGKSHADIKTGKRGRAIVEGGRGTAARSLAVLGAMLQFGVARKLIPMNPAKSVQLLKGAKKERFLSEAELTHLAETLEAMEGEHKISATAAASIRLLLLTGCRKSEILGLRWE
jgi:integrase